MIYEYGSDYEETELDNLGSTLKIIRKVHGKTVSARYKQYRIRMKVYDKAEEGYEYQKFTDMIAEKRKTAVLVRKETDPSYLPSFIIDYPVANKDGSYFVIKCWTELSL